MEPGVGDKSVPPAPRGPQVPLPQLGRGVRSPGKSQEPPKFPGFDWLSAAPSWQRTRSVEGPVVGNLLSPPLPSTLGLQVPHGCLPSPEQAWRLGRHGRNQDARSPSDLEWAPPSTQSSREPVNALLPAGNDSWTPERPGSEGRGAEAFAPTFCWLPGCWPVLVLLGLWFSGGVGTRKPVLPGCHPLL